MSYTNLLQRRYSHRKYRQYVYNSCFDAKVRASFQNPLEMQANLRFVLRKI